MSRDDDCKTTSLVPLVRLVGGERYKRAQHTTSESHENPEKQSNQAERVRPRGVPDDQVLAWWRAHSENTLTATHRA